eukprot:CAMPEP_0173415624 /NCGR_PEP_ID=MMETSP1356-20130122/84961_1 /TAXON_ID=77927 ORGANISM="Hemiselmis virescens, Strain PCC157" /NCGR_SAMPLE_ID=MMETSP1356 /ASSEMBLY_ACC=CAM_ASM_000847 /LENGTH=213 /DNA_ID=CAMNT_0014377885 /DNA_START=149 /DNA_END=790 /DNA_ORIENTATION=-
MNGRKARPPSVMLGATSSAVSETVSPSGARRNSATNSPAYGMGPDPATPLGTWLIEAGRHLPATPSSTPTGARVEDRRVLGAVPAASGSGSAMQMEPDNLVQGRDGDDSWSSGLVGNIMGMWKDLDRAFGALKVVGDGHSGSDTSVELEGESPLNDGKQQPEGAAAYKAGTIRRWRGSASPLSRHAAIRSVRRCSAEAAAVARESDDALRIDM